jgi:hypothetical protein
MYEQTNMRAQRARRKAFLKGSLATLERLEYRLDSCKELDDLCRPESKAKRRIFYGNRAEKKRKKL